MSSAPWIYILVAWVAVAVVAVPWPKKGANAPIDFNLLKKGNSKADAASKCSGLDKEIQGYMAKLVSLQMELKAKYPDSLVKMAPENTGNRGKSAPASGDESALFDLQSSFNSLCTQINGTAPEVVIAGKLNNKAILAYCRNHTISGDAN